MQRSIRALGPTLCVLVISVACSKDWTAKPSQPVSGKLIGTSFTIELPEGMEKQPADADWSVEWKLPGGGAHAPSVTVADHGSESPHPRRPTSADDELTHVSPSASEEVVRKEATADGFAITEQQKSKTYVTAHVVRIAGEKVLTCDAATSGGVVGAVANFDAVKASLEKICGSLKIQ